MWDDAFTTNKNATTDTNISALLAKALPKGDMLHVMKDFYHRYKIELEKFRRSEEKVTTLKKENKEWKDAAAKAKIEMEQLRITYEGTIQSLREQLDAQQREKVMTLKKEKQEWKDAATKAKIEMEQLRTTYEGTIQSLREQLEAHQRDNDEAQNQVQES